MQTDIQIEKEVRHQLRLDPDDTIRNISSSAQDGVVTLRGKAGQSFEKLAAEMIVWRVSGVRAIINEIEVKPPHAHEKSDAELAQEALKALAASLSAPQQFRVTIDEGWITLGGQTNWDTERMTAQNILSGISGVKGVTSNVAVMMKERRSSVRGGAAHRDW